MIPTQTQPIARLAQPGLLARTRARQLGLGIGSGLVGFIAAALSVEVHRRVTGILGLRRRDRGPCPGSS